MFSIHGITGQTFPGTLEYLIQVPGVTPLPLHEASAGRAKKSASKPLNPAAKQPPYLATSQLQAVAAYRRMLPHELERDRLYHAWQVFTNAPSRSSQQDVKSGIG